jgi:hypothetical protein
MNRYIWLLLLSIAPLSASAQRTPPDNLQVCFSSGDCVHMLIVSDYYLGYTGPKMNTEWRFTVDAWTMEKLELSGRSTLHEGIFQHSSRWTIKGTPDVIKDGIARAKAKDMSGHDDRAGKVTVTWEPSQPKVYGRVIR